MIRLNISIYISLDQNLLEIEINHPHNTEVINLFLRNWRHYDGLQKHQEDCDKVKFFTMEDLKNSHDFNDVIPNIKRQKGSKLQRQMRLNIKPNIIKVNIKYVVQRYKKFLTKGKSLKWTKI